MDDAVPLPPPPKNARSRRPRRAQQAPTAEERLASAEAVRNVSRSIKRRAFQLRLQAAGCVVVIAALLCGGAWFFLFAEKIVLEQFSERSEFLADKQALIEQEQARLKELSPRFDPKSGSWL